MNELARQPVRIKWWGWIIIGIIGLAVLGLLTEALYPRQSYSNIEEFKAYHNDGGVLLEHDEYYQVISDNHILISEEYKWLMNHLLSYDGAEEWYSSFKEGALRILFLIEEAEDDIKPPQEKQQNYARYIEALQDYRAAMDIALYAADTGLDDSQYDAIIAHSLDGAEKIQDLMEGNH